MTRWACSLLADNGPDIRHGVCFVEATTRDEAIGKAYRIARKAYPGMSVHATVLPADAPALDPDRPVEVTPFDGEPMP